MVYCVFIRQPLIEISMMHTQKRSVSNAADIGAPKGALDNVPEQPEFCIDAGTCGNVSRMINHSCEPNLFVQCVLNDHHDLSQPRIWFFAADTISPLQVNKIVNIFSSAYLYIQHELL